MAIPGDLELFLVPALVLLILLYHAGRILYREAKTGYEAETAERAETE